MDIDPGDKSEDKKLFILLDLASDWLGEAMGITGGIDKKERTEYYNGNGKALLNLKHRPVFTTPALQVSSSLSGFFGSPSGSFDSDTLLTYGTDYCLKIDQDDGTSRCGTLIKIRGYWPTQGRRDVGLLSPYVAPGQGSVKIVYTAGWTIDTLPSMIRQACDLLVARLANIWPVGMELNSENYIDRSISAVVSEKSKLMALITPLVISRRNWSF